VLPAQQIAPQKPTGSVFIRPYIASTIPPVRLANSLRARDLIRGGNLYLTVQDAIALAIENSIDLELDRYGPITDQWNLERFEAGGPLPGVPNATSTGKAVASGQGVAGSQSAAGVSTSGANNNTGNTAGATISQIGPTTPTLDPVFQNVQNYSHTSSPQANTTQSQVLNLVQNQRNYTESISTGLITGGQASLTYNDSYLNENAPSDLLNPSNFTTLTLSLRHNFLQGFGTAVNSRNITVAKNNLKLDNYTFENEAIAAVVNVLNLYYGLVADYQDVKAKQSAVEVAQRFYEDNRKQVQIGTMAPIDVTTAEAQVASSQQDFVVSQTTLEQQQVQLKNALSRNGLADPLFREVTIIPLDRIEVPEESDLPPLKTMVATALANRPDLAAEQLNVQNLQTSALGTLNGVRPQLAGLASFKNTGSAGTARYVPIPPDEVPQFANSPLPSGIVPCPPNVGPKGSLCQVPDPYFVGGIGTALGQMIRRNFPSESGGGFIAPVIRNRQAQADAAIDQLTIRQTQVQTQRDLNEVVVDVSNQMVALQQARARYAAAVRSRILEQQLLDAEQKKFKLGASTTYSVVTQQRDLALAQSAEVAALVAFSNAQVSLDETLGTTLKTNHVSLQEAKTGIVERKSSLPATLPATE
jgi:outer membrane protein TolC